MLEWPRPARIPAEDEALRSEIRAFLAEHLPDLPPDILSRSWMGFDAEFSRKLGAAGWLGLTIPAEYGGGGRNAFARFVVVEELLARGAPVAAHWIADRQSAPLILKFGTEAQRQQYIPAICRGELYFCIGMSEPGSGSDLASVQTRATRNEQGWQLKGRKIWTTMAHHSHYMIALVRTSGGPEDRQQGLSQFIIDLSLPGVTVEPIRDLSGDAHFNEVIFDDVQLPADALIGEEGAGWRQVNAELAFERSGPERILSAIMLLETWITWLREHGHGNADEELAGRLAARLAVLRAFSISVTGRLAEGASPVVEAALFKDVGTGFEQSLAPLISDALGRRPEQPLPEVLERTLAYTAAIAPSYSLRGGTREILRGMVARGMGLR